MNDAEGRVPACEGAMRVGAGGQEVGGEGGLVRRGCTLV